MSGRSCTRWEQMNGMVESHCTCIAYGKQRAGAQHDNLLIFTFPAPKTREVLSPARRPIVSAMIRRDKVSLPYSFIGVRVFRPPVPYLLRRSYCPGSKSSIRAQDPTVIPVAGFIKKFTKRKMKKISDTSYL